jgi:hypothetical protein
VWVEKVSFSCWHLSKKEKVLLPETEKRRNGLQPKLKHHAGYQVDVKLKALRNTAKSFDLDF